MTAYSVPFVYSCFRISIYACMLLQVFNTWLYFDFRIFWYSCEFSGLILYYVTLQMMFSTLYQGLKQWGFFLVVLGVYFLVGQSCGCSITGSCKARLDGATWSSWRYPCSWQGSWNQTSLGSLPTPNHSMILWFWCNPPAARYSVDFCKHRGKEAKCHMGESFKGDCTTAGCSEE